MTSDADRSTFEPVSSMVLRKSFSPRVPGSFLWPAQALRTDEVIHLVPRECTPRRSWIFRSHSPMPAQLRWGECRPFMRERVALTTGPGLPPCQHALMSILSPLAAGRWLRFGYFWLFLMSVSVRRHINKTLPTALKCSPHNTAKISINWKILYKQPSVKEGNK